MADIFVYAHDCTDFDNIGLAGSLVPLSCLHSEIKNGMSELEIVHPIDDAGKWAFLQEGYILQAEVPVRTLPEIGENAAMVTETERWTVRLAATKGQRKVYSKSSGGKAITTLPIYSDKAHTIPYAITVVRKGGTRYKFKTGRRWGWIAISAIEHDISGDTTLADDPAAIETVAPAWTIKPQRFRIYKVERKPDAVTVLAKHIFYNHAKNITSYDGAKTYDGWNSSTAYVIGDRVTRGAYSYYCIADNTNQVPPNTAYWIDCLSCFAALQGLVSGCVAENDLNPMTNLLATRVGIKWERVPFVEALLAPDTGLVNLWGAEIVRDNEDFCLLHEAGLNRGVTIEYGKNLLGVELSVDLSNVVTRYIPVGQDHKGKPLLLAAGTYYTDHGTIVIPDGQYWVDSAKVGDYATVQAEVLDLGSKAKAGTSSTSIRDAREKMIDACMTKFEDEHTDDPELTLSVEFFRLGDTAEFAQYKQLEDVYLYDRVRIRHPKINVDVLAEVTEYEYDVLRDRPSRITLGYVQQMNKGKRIPAWELPTNIPGTAIARETVDTGALADGVKLRAVGGKAVITPRLDALDDTIMLMAHDVDSYDGATYSETEPIEPTGTTEGVAIGASEGYNYDGTAVTNDIHSYVRGRGAMQVRGEKELVLTVYKDGETASAAMTFGTQYHPDGAVAVHCNLIPATHNAYYIGSDLYTKRWIRMYSMLSPDYPSDARIKRDISDLGPELIDLLRPVQYRLIDRPDKIHFGLIAQEVKAALDALGIVDTDLFSADNPDCWSLRYDELFAPMIAKDQAQQRQIDALTKRLDALEKQLGGAAHGVAD